MIGNSNMASSRNGEGPLWKLLRLWPLLIAVVAISGMIYVTSYNVTDLQAADKIQWRKIGDNREDITELEKQTGIIEWRLQNVDNALAEQKGDIKEILKAVQK